MRDKKTGSFLKSTDYFEKDLPKIKRDLADPKKIFWRYYS